MKPIKKGQSCQCHPGHVIYNAKVCVPCGGASTQLPSGSVVDSFYVDQYGQCTCREGFLLDHKSSTCLPCRGHGAHVLDGKCTCQPTQVPPLPTLVADNTCACPAGYGWSGSKCFNCDRLGYDYYEEESRSCKCGTGASYSEQSAECVPVDCPRKFMNFYLEQELRWTCIECYGPGSTLVDGLCTCTKENFILTNGTCTCADGYVRVKNECEEIVPIYGAVLLPPITTQPTLVNCADDSQPYYPFRQFYTFNELSGQCELQKAEFSFLILLLLLLLLLPLLCIQLGILYRFYPNTDLSAFNYERVYHSSRL